MKSSGRPLDSISLAALLAAGPLTLLALTTAPPARAATPAPCAAAWGDEKPSTHPKPAAPLPSSRGPADSMSTSGASSPSPSAAPAHKKCPYATQECLNYMAQRLKTAGWIGIEYDTEKSGYPEVQKVVPGSPAEQAGLEVGDALISLNGVEIKEGNDEKLKAARGDWTPGHTIHYMVKRKGKLKPVDITLGTWPADVLARYIGEHMLEHAEADAQAQAQATPSPKK
jgi:membrane-associated protease RseP (regulator of RpoE activity)